MKRKRTWIVWGFFFVLVFTASTQLSAQLTIEESISIIELPIDEQAVHQATDEAEKVNERFADGRLKTERSVAIDKNGNYVNHGRYREFTLDGKVHVEGTYNWGSRQGTWTRQLSGDDAKRIQQQSVNTFKPPYVSTVEFANGKLHGIWVIADANGNIMVQVQLKDGARDGTTSYFDRNGEIRRQATFCAGVLHGEVIDMTFDARAKQEKYTDGRRSMEDFQRARDGKLKAVYTQLSPIYKVVTPDDWDRTVFARVDATGEKVLHGAFQTYYPNGNVSSKGNYKLDALDGVFESWYPTGEIAVSGRYERGLQAGEWVWRHANGMKSAVAIYDGGKPVGQALAWDKTGRSIKSKTKDSQPSETARVSAVATEDNVLR